MKFSFPISLLLLTITFASVNADSEKVSVQLGLMSGCPCTAQFIYDFKRTIVDDVELWKEIHLTQVWAATPHASKNESTCFHGKKECDFETYLVCSQKLFGDENTLLWNECCDGTCDGDYQKMTPCKTQYVNPSNETLMETCGYDILGSEFNYDDLKS